MEGLIWFIYLIFYAYIAIGLMIIAQKTGNQENAWWAWIPILNILLMLQIAKKPLWWIILFIIPFVNLVIAIVVWWTISEARGKEGWMSILLLIPVVNLFIYGYLAFSD